MGNKNVYCMDVPETKNFIANGFVSHNCLDALRYALFSHFFNKAEGSLTASDIDRAYNESYGRNEQCLPDQFIDPREYEVF